MKLLHLSGAGNDFLLLDIRRQQLDLSELAKTACHQYGADGLLALDDSDCADFRMHFYNSDGSRGELCGNGLRCICRFAYDRGLVADSITVQTDAGLAQGWRMAENRYRVRLNNPGYVDLHRLPNAAYVELGSPGIPHSVTLCPHLDWAEKEQLLPEFLALRHSSAFPKGVNVNFYRPLGENGVQILTYERGVEDFTLACGTGSASVAVCLWLEGRLPGGQLTVENPGGRLNITVEGENGVITALYLEGPAEVLGAYEY